MRWIQVLWQDFVAILLALVFSAVLLGLLASAAFSQPPKVPSVPEDKPFAFPPIAVPPVVTPSLEPAKAPSDRPHKEVALRAYKLGKRVTLFVGHLPKDDAGTLSVYVESHPWGRGVYLCSPTEDGWLEYVSTVGKVVSPPARPFRRGEVRPTADDDLKATGPWPKSLLFPADAERYLPAKYTQSIFKYVTSGSQIERIDRRDLFQKWQVPGGMEGIEGWRSDLYRYIPPGYRKSWQALLPVRNGDGFIQHELGWTRAYPDGTYFIDALSNDLGQPFEIRMREKQDGKWYSYVAFRDPAARPRGYDGLKRTCASCHDQAGTGGYGTGLVPGGDTVLSDPLEGLE